MSTNTEDQLEFDLGEGEEETEVSLGEETTEDVGGEKFTANPESTHRDELEAVSDNVQKRISKLTARMREAERREQAAIDYAKGMHNQAQTLQQRLVNTDFSRLSETKSRLETQQGTLKAIIRRAREEGDIDTETEAQQRLTDLVMEQRQVAGWLQQQQQQIENYKQAPQQAQQQAPSPKPAPSPRAERWAESNPWFGQDRVLTYAAWGMHQTLVEQEGVDPNTEEYYTELDRRLRDEFPKRFATAQPNRQQRSVPAVAPASRSSGVNSARRTVRLSPSQVAIAKKLGVPLEEYAKYVKE